MKIALVHDDFIQYGGAEKLVLAFHELWPEAPIYTSIVSHQWQKRAKEMKVKFVTSFMQRLPFAEKLNRYYSPFLFHALAFESFNFDDFDVVLSSSSRFAHSIITKPHTLHICYMNSPGRMFWESNDYFNNEDYALLKPIKSLARPFLSFPLSHLRKWDYVASRRPDLLIANSKLPKRRIKKYYQRDAKIIYPFVDYSIFQKSPDSKGDYFVILTRLVSWKKIDIAIRACNTLKLPLKIIGVGPDTQRLKGISGPTIEFLGYAKDERIPVLLGCKALINTQEEDFGIVPLEALACGKPVIAYGKGGALETVVDGKTGMFFYEQTEESLIDALKNFNSNNYNSKDCREQAQRYHKDIFMHKIHDLVEKEYTLFKSKENL